MKRLTLLLLLSMYQLTFSTSNQYIQYLFPIPQSTMLAKEAVIIVRFEQVRPNEINNLKSFIRIRGSQSGDIAGKTLICTDQKTINFKPDQYFIPGERISVTLNPHITGEEHAFIDSTFYFDVSPVTEIPTHIKERRIGKRTSVMEKKSMSKLSNGRDPLVLNGVSVPSDFPEVEITINDNPDSGLIFMTGNRYLLILDNDGNPVWYRPTDGEPGNLSTQEGYLTVIVWVEEIGDCYIVAFDSTYTLVREYKPPEGYRLDDHDIKLLPNGHYMVIVTDEQQMDLSHLGGHSDAWVVGNHVAEMDSEDNLVFFWRSWDFFDVADAIHMDFDWQYIDYIHMNSIDLDLDGHIIVSSRHLSELTKINRQTGDIIWRLGGENDYFTWVNDDYRTSYQHDFRALPNGNYILFDNGNFRYPEFSRALELSLNTNTWEVSKVWEYRENPDIFVGGAGSVQKFPNGNTGIAWTYRTQPILTEVRPDKSKAFEMKFKVPPEAGSPFVRRALWNGMSDKPSLIVEPYMDRITLIFNKFGDSDVVEYKIYGGLNPSPTEILATTADPFIHLTNLQNNEYYYFRVTAVNTSGVESDFSDEKHVQVSIFPTGANLITNGDFSDGITEWNWETDQNGQATWEITVNGEFQFNILNSGSNLSDIQLIQPGISLIKGEMYKLEFDAQATNASRIIEVEMKNGMWPNTNYSKMGLNYIHTDMEHFSHEFTMEENSDSNAEIVINVGGSDIGVVVDNISLKPQITSVNDKFEKIPDEYNLGLNYPNPFNPTTAIGYQLSAVSDVELSIYNLVGQKVATLVSEKQRAGYHQVEWDASGFASGIYYYKIEAGEFVDVKKMILLR